MFRRSLRFRLSVLSTLLFGLLLVGVSIAAWRAVYRIQIKRVDDLLAQNVIREMGTSPTPVQWRLRQRNVSTWPAMLLRYPMLAIVSNGDPVFISPSWPDEMATTGYTLPEGGPLLRRRLLGPHLRPFGPLMTLTAVLPNTGPEDLADAPFHSPEDATAPPQLAPDSLEGDLEASTVGRVATNPDSLSLDQRWVDPFAPPANQPPIAWAPPTGPLPDPFAAVPSEAAPVGPVASDPFGPISIAPEPDPLPVIDPADAATTGLSTTGEATSTLPLPDSIQRSDGPPVLRTIEYSTRDANGNSWRVAVGGNAGITLVILSDLSPVLTDMAELRQQLILISLFCLAFVALLSWYIVGNALRPVAVLSDTIEKLTIETLVEGLDHPHPAHSRDREFERLVNVYNEMVKRLETSFDQARRFSADAAHELRTPLTILQGELENALHQAPEGSREQETLGSLLDEVQRLKVIVQQLLLLSRADSGRLRLNLEPLNLSHAVEMIVEDLEMLAPHLRIKTRIPPGVMINCEPILLRQVIQNLVTNAIRYNVPVANPDAADGTDPDQGCIVIRLNANQDQARLAISNSGPPILNEDRDRIFLRFYRGDTSRDRAIDGTGLGLSLCYEILRSHRGTIRLGEPEESEVDPIHGRLTTFIVHLPVSPIPIGDSGLRKSSVPLMPPMDKPPASGPTANGD